MRRPVQKREVIVTISVKEKNETPPAKPPGEEKTQCGGFTTKGERCKKRCDASAGFCIYHDREEARGEQLFQRKCCGVSAKGKRCRNVMKTADPNRKYCYAHIPCLPQVIPGPNANGLAQAVH